MAESGRAGWSFVGRPGPAVGRPRSGSAIGRAEGHRRAFPLEGVRSGRYVCPRDLPGLRLPDRSRRAALPPVAAPASPRGASDAWRAGCWCAAPSSTGGPPGCWSTASSTVGRRRPPPCWPPPWPAPCRRGPRLWCRCRGRGCGGGGTGSIPPSSWPEALGRVLALPVVPALAPEWWHRRRAGPAGAQRGMPRFRAVRPVPAGGGPGGRRGDHGGHAPGRRRRPGPALRCGHRHRRAGEPRLPPAAAAGRGYSDLKPPSGDADDGRVRAAWKRTTTGSALDSCLPAAPGPRPKTTKEVTVEVHVRGKRMSIGDDLRRVAEEKVARSIRVFEDVGPIDVEFTDEQNPTAGGRALPGRDHHQGGGADGARRSGGLRSPLRSRPGRGQAGAAVEPAEGAPGRAPSPGRGQTTQ